MKRLFIIGGTGFLGKSMLDYRLCHSEWEWANAEWAVLSRSSERFIEGCPRLANQIGVSFVAGDVRGFDFPEDRFGVIVHAATSAVTTLSDDKMTSIITDSARRVADFAKAAECQIVILTSSGAVCGSRFASVRGYPWLKERNRRKGHTEPRRKAIGPCVITQSRPGRTWTRGKSLA